MSRAEWAKRGRVEGGAELQVNPVIRGFCCGHSAAHSGVLHTDVHNIQKGLELYSNMTVATDSSLKTLRQRN